MRTRRGRKTGRPRLRGGRPATTKENIRVRDLLARFWPFTQGLRKWMFVVLVLLALVPLIQAAEIWLFKLLIDDVLVPGDLGLLPLLALAYVVANIFSGALSFADEWISTRTGGEFLLRVRQNVFGHLIKLSPAQIGRRQLGDLLSRLSGDVGAIERFVVHGVPTAVESGVKLVLFASIAVILDPLLAGLAFVVAPVFWLIARRVSTAVREASRRNRVSSGRQQSVAEETLSSIAQVQTANAQSFEEDRYRKEGKDVLRAELDSAKVRGLFGPLADLVELVGGLAVITAGAWSLSTGRLTLGELLAFMTYLTQMYRPIRDLTDLSASAFSAAAGAERVAEILDQEPLITESGDGLDLPHINGAIELDDVSYRYPGRDNWALQDVSLRIDPGSVVAIVGPSGSGKTTLTNLLLRFADPDQGSIRLDGRDLRDLKLSSVRNAIGLMLQDTYLFDASIRENVAYGSPDVSDAQVDAALQDTNALGFATDLPGGLDFRVGQKGSALSGGQRRRIALARALIGDPGILVLDEYSAGLDPQVARRVLASLTADRERTVLLVTHDPEIAEVADRVVVLDDGRVLEDETVEEGSHLPEGTYTRLMDRLSDSPLGAS